MASLSYQTLRGLLQLWKTNFEYERKIHLRTPKLLEHGLNTCGCYSIAFLHRTPIFYWCVVKVRFKSKPRKDTCSKEIGLRFLRLSNTPHWIVNGIERTYVSSSQRTNKHAIMIILTNQGEAQFSIWLLLMFHHIYISLLM